MDVKWKETEVQPFICRMFPTYCTINMFFLEHWSLHEEYQSLQHVSVISAFKHQYQKYMFEGQKSTSPLEALIYTSYMNTCKKIGLCSWTAPWEFLWSASFDAISISLGGSLCCFPSVSVLQLADGHLLWDRMEFHYMSYLVNHVIMPNIHLSTYKKSVKAPKNLENILLFHIWKTIWMVGLRTWLWWR